MTLWQMVSFKKLIAEHCDAVGVNGVVDHFKFMNGKGGVQIDIGNRGGKITHQAIDVGSHYSISTKRGYTRYHNWIDPPSTRWRNITDQ